MSERDATHPASGIEDVAVDEPDEVSVITAVHAATAWVLADADRVAAAAKQAGMTPPQFEAAVAAFLTVGPDRPGPSPTAVGGGTLDDCEMVTEWGHVRFDEPVPLVPRERVQIGDVVQSSHGYRGVVTEVRIHPHPEGTAYLNLELHNEGSGVFRSEIYDKTSTIPVLARRGEPAPDQGTVWVPMPQMPRA